MAAGDVAGAASVDAGRGKHPPSPIPSPPSKRLRRQGSSTRPLQEGVALGEDCGSGTPVSSEGVSLEDGLSNPGSRGGEVGRFCGSTYRRNGEASPRSSPRVTPYLLRSNRNVALEVSPKVHKDLFQDLSFVLAIESPLKQMMNGDAIPNSGESTEARDGIESKEPMLQVANSPNLKVDDPQSKESELEVASTVAKAETSSEMPPFVESADNSTKSCSTVVEKDIPREGKDDKIVMRELDNSQGVASSETTPTPISNSAGVSASKHPRKKFLLRQLGINVDDMVPDDGNATYQGGRRRLTRSMQRDQTEIVAFTPPVSKEIDTPSVSKEIDTPSVKKMEMKMSKKVRLTTPGNVRELLATGLLDGLPVMYIIPNSKKPVLKGKIQERSILCFCSMCNGSKAVAANLFEVHANSTKKHPSDYIYLENGNSLKDVLKLCAVTPLDMLEAAIREAVTPSSGKEFSSCLNCSGLLDSPDHQKMLCKSCCNSNQAKVLLSAVHANHSENSLPEASPYLSSKKSPSVHANHYENSLPEASPYSSSKRSPSMHANHSENSVPEASAYSSSKKSFVQASNSKGNMEGRLTKKDTGLHKLVFKDGFLENFEVGYFVRGKKVNSGRIKDGGIYCGHCKMVVSPSQFEAHAGQASRKKAYDYIYVIEKGYSLHEIAAEIAQRTKRFGSESDSLCCVCGLEDNLIGCDRCPRAYHLGCIDVTNRPKESWYCNFCLTLAQKEKTLASNRNAIAAGRVAGDNSMEELFTRIVRVVSTDVDPGCTLCKEKDFSRSSFGGRTVLLCDQCQREYHVECLRMHGLADLKELPEGEWFCRESCSEVHSAIQEKIQHGAEHLPSSDIDMIRTKYKMKGLEFNSDTEVRWQILSGNTCADENRSMLSKAVEIFHESFDPIVDQGANSDLIPAMVYGMGDYAGMHCILLTVGSSVVSVGILRIMGIEIAELPLVATSRDLQGLGYFQAMFSCLERLLASLKVKHFVLPAAEKAESIWTKKFGFSRIPLEQLRNYLNGAYWTAFSGTVSLYKSVPLLQSDDGQTNA